MIDINKSILKILISICILSIFNSGCVSFKNPQKNSKTYGNQKSHKILSIDENDSINEIIQQLPTPLEVKIVGYVNKDILEMFSSPQKIIVVNHVIRGTKIFIFDTSGNWGNISADVEYPYWVNLDSICFTQDCWKQNQIYKAKSSLNISNTSTKPSRPAKSNYQNKKISSNSGKGYTNVDGKYVSSPTRSNKQPPNATAKCRDGTWSFSLNRRGTCSGHGGVAHWL